MQMHKFYNRFCGGDSGDKGAGGAGGCRAVNISDNKHQKTHKFKKCHSSYSFSMQMKRFIETQPRPLTPPARPLPARPWSLCARSPGTSQEPQGDEIPALSQRSSSSEPPAGEVGWRAVSSLSVKGRSPLAGNKLTFQVKELWK